MSIKLKKINFLLLLIIFFIRPLNSNQIIFEKKDLLNNGQNLQNLSEIGKEDLESQMWNQIFINKSFQDIEIFLSNLPNKSSNEVVQKLIFKFLSSKKIISKNLINSDQDKTILELYVQQLFETGRINEIELYYSQSPELKNNEFILKKMIEGNLLRNRHSEACKILENKTNNTPKLFGKIIIICDILNNRYEQAKLGLSLLKEQNKPGDIFFIDLAYSLMSEENISESDNLKKNLEQIKTLNPIIMSSLQFADISPSYEQIENLNTSGLLFILSNPSVDTDLKVFCSEILVKQGRIGVDVLSEAYQLARFKNSEIENALRLYKTLSPAKARPLLYQSILRESNDELKLKKILALLKSSANDNLIRQISLLIADFLPPLEILEKKEDILLISKMFQSRRDFFKAEAMLGKLMNLNDDPELLFRGISLEIAKYLNNQNFDSEALETKLIRVSEIEKIDLEKFRKIIMVLTLNINFSQNLFNVLSESNFLTMGNNEKNNLQNLFLAERFSKEDNLFNSLIIFFKVIGNKDFEDLSLLENYKALMILRNLGFEQEFKALSESILL